MNQFEQMLAIAPTVLALNACEGRGGVDEDYAEGYQDGYEDAQDGGADDGDGGVEDEQDDSHARLCEQLVAEADEAYEDGFTANVTVDAVPHTLESGEGAGVVWMKEDFTTDDGNDQFHVACPSLKIDGDWEFAGEVDLTQNAPYLNLKVNFDEEDAENSDVVGLEWVVLGEEGARFATDYNGDTFKTYSLNNGEILP